MFGFTSELKAFHTHPNFMGVANQGALTLFLRHNNVPAPHCIYDGLPRDGGDELFGGYNRYMARDRVARFNRRTPRGFERLFIR